LLTRLNHFLLFMGIPGLFLVSLIDSAVAPIAGGPDALVILLAWRQPSLTSLIVLAATAGSTIGCLFLYGIGKKGGKKALSRFKPEKIAWVENYMNKRGFWTILASVLIPPPFPTKLVVIAAGVFQTNKLQFFLGILLGRLARYAALGYLAAHFGSNVTQVLKGYFPMISLALIGLVLLIILIRSLRTERAA
jgi:membrane protein YqaA with SNARE-associated domain